MPVPTTFARSIVLVAICALTIGVAACGDSDDGTSAETSQTTQAPTSDGSSKAPDRNGRGEEDRVATVVEDMYADLAQSDARGVCAAMTGTARRQIAQGVPGGSTEAPADRTCEKSLAKFLALAAQSGVLEQTLRADVREVEISGDVATAQVAFGGQPGPIRLTKEDGKWRFGADAVAPPR